MRAYRAANGLTLAVKAANKAAQAMTPAMKYALYCGQRSPTKDMVIATGSTTTYSGAVMYWAVTESYFNASTSMG